MAEATLTQLQTHIEAIRHEAFAEGYAAAMEAIRELSSRSVTQQGRNIPALKGGTDGEGQAQQPERRRGASPLRTSSAARRSPARARSTRVIASVTRRPRGRRQRGTNARMIHAILKQHRRVACGKRRSAMRYRPKAFRWRTRPLAMRSDSWRRARRPSRSARPRAGVIQRPAETRCVRRAFNGWCERSAGNLPHDRGGLVLLHGAADQPAKILGCQKDAE